MHTETKLIFGVFLLFFIIPSGWSIKCWKCRSNNDPKCADPFDNSTIPITDCAHEKGISHLPGLCRKIRQKVNGEWQYFRDCAYLGEEGIQGNERDNDIFIESCNNKDGCNSSSMFTPLSLITLVASSVIFKMFV